MNNLSYTQKYFLCAVNSNGDIPVLSTDVSTCLVAGGMLELTRHGYITYDDKKNIEIKKPWDNALPYLAPLYDTIASFKGSKKAKAVLEAFALSVSSKKLKELVTALRASLLSEGCLDEQSDRGLVKEKARYIPKSEIVTQIIEEVRTGFLKEGPVADDVVCLSVLLVKGNLIKNYFSKVEGTKMKARVKEIRQSEAYASVKDIFDYMDAAIAAVIIISAT